MHACTASVTASSTDTRMRGRWLSNKANRVRKPRGCSADKTAGCVCVCFHLFWTSSSLDVPAGVTQEEGHTGFLIHLPSAVHAFIFLARRIQPLLSLVDREVEFRVLTI